MAEGNYVMEGWEWESLFPSSLLEQDITWYDEVAQPRLTVSAATDSRTISQTLSGSALGFPGTFANPEFFLTSRPEGDGDSTPIATSAVIATNTSDGSLDSSGYNHDTPVSSHHLSSETSLINPPATSTTKKKKRDPRLECPNFLAGRIPCSCPEEDELEFEEDAEVQALVTKRSKVAARCQVPSCGEDISHLKGYHQRHRVCLACANSPKVMLKDQPHRYCQQCGKFHRISDFDEGKRSCRRKLERHNRRRRRRPAEEDEEALDGEAPLFRDGVDSNKIQSFPEDVAAQDTQTLAASTKQGLGAQMAHTELGKEGAPFKDEGKAEPALKQISDTCLVDILQNREVGRVAQNFTNSIDIADQHASDEMSASALRFDKEIISSIETKSDEHLLLNMLVENADHRAEQDTEQMKQPHALKSEATRASCSRRKRVEYVTPRPTGRISFKLYDWNPADFPRRLRQQIFEWLANMPVELESYVRSGCIILTFFVTMPQPMWDKVLADWKGQVQKFILNSGTKLLGMGQLTTQMAEKSIYFKHGKVRNAYCKDMLAPFLVDLYPSSLEAGCSTQIYVSGFNFTGARFLVSFGEYYVECSDSELVDIDHFANQTVRSSSSNLEVQKLTVFLPDSKKFGLAYVEVESVHGVSNFMPFLVADKDVCAEINAFSENHASSAALNHKITSTHEGVEASRSQYLTDILSDLGWSLKYMNKGLLTEKAEVRETLMNRLQSLLIFSSEHCCHAITQRLVETALHTVITQCNYGFPHSPHGRSSWSMSDDSNDLKTISNLKAEQDFFTSKFAVLSKVDGYQAVERPTQTKGLQGPKAAAKLLISASTSVQLEKPDRNSFLSFKGPPATAMDVPLLEERIPILEEGWRPKGCWTVPLSYPRQPIGTTRTSFMCVSNRKFYRVLIAAVGVVTVCTGMCFMLQHPHEVSEISMSLRRCLWGSYTGVRHV